MNWRNKWILNEHGEPVCVEDAMVWADWFEHSREKRIVKQERIGRYKISTVFLGLDHNWSPKGPPILWETMVFRLAPGMDKLRPPPSGDYMDLMFEQCAGGREQAEAMHERMVERVRKGQNEQRNKI